MGRSILPYVMHGRLGLGAGSQNSRGYSWGSRLFDRTPSLAVVLQRTRLPKQPCRCTLSSYQITVPGVKCRTNIPPLVLQLPVDIDQSSYNFPSISILVRKLNQQCPSLSPTLSLSLSLSLILALSLTLSLSLSLSLSRLGTCKVTAGPAAASCTWSRPSTSEERWALVRFTVR